MDLELKIDGTNGDIEIFIGKSYVSELDHSDGSTVITFYNKRYVMTYHPKRRGWEFPSGKREENETIYECAKRETFEETGAILSEIIPLGYYLVKTNESVFKTAIFMANVDKFESKPYWSETNLVKLFDELPQNISYKDDVYKIIVEYIKKMDGGTV